MSEKKYTELKVLSDTSCLFNESDAKYVIPLYQRAYAWGDTEIVQLLDDINDVELFSDSSKYYLGSLIVYQRQDGSFEVIDGQQRLTTLFLLLNSMPGLHVENTLSFECREKSNYTLKNILQLVGKDKDNLEQQIVSGKTIIERELQTPRFSIDNFIEKLKRVCLYRIEVPEHTDLNRYFEIMNTRGEQLEQQDIVKSDLMSSITDPREQLLFAEIWDACSDMTGYVQMHFSISNRGEDLGNARDTLFGYYWNEYPTDEKIEQLCSLQFTNDSDCVHMTDIIADSFSVNSVDGTNDDNDRVRFESIIDFRFLLLHVLRIFVHSMRITSDNPDVKLIDELLDDKKLRSSFQNVLEYGQIDGVPIDKNDFSLGFVNCLLKVRWLFDKYIIKREYVNESSDGAWSLKELKVSGSKTQRKPYYSNTAINKYREWETTYGPRNRINLMLQSCLRVSYTSPKVMHWLTEILSWLYDDTNREHLDELSEITKNIARKATKELFLDGQNFDMGVNTPHIVFNYLDYLLWEQDALHGEPFAFEFRNSVEHWYPQHPTEGTFQEWVSDAGLNNFGNLCIIQRNINSKFSNMDPVAKKVTFKEDILKGSIKLRLMAKATRDSYEWKISTYKEHGDAMIAVLMQDCNPEISSEESLEAEDSVIL